MQWFLIRVASPAAQAEDAAASLAALGCSGVRIMDGEPAMLEAHFPKDVTGPASAVVAPWGAKIDKAEWVEEEDWAEAWKKRAPAIVVGRICVHPSHEAPRKGLLNIKIDPGMAFGTGDHPTTRMMLIEAQAMAGVRPLGRVLDLGCGSGVLSMAAAQLGASEIVALDIDRKAVEVARENAKANGMERIRIIEGSLGKAQGRFDTILANLTTDVHLAKSSEYMKKLNEGGRLRLGGVRTTESESVARTTGTLVARSEAGWSVLKTPNEGAVPRPAPGARKSEDPPTLVPHLISPEKMKVIDRETEPMPEAAKAAAPGVPAPSIPTPASAISASGITAATPKTVDRRRGAFHHMDLNVSNLEDSRSFYGRLLPRLGFERGDWGKDWAIFTHGDFYLTLVQAKDPWRKQPYHRKGVGVNHLAFSAPSKDAVDVLHEWLVWEGITVLYGGPMEMGDIEHPNYAVYFEDPDRLKLEYVYRA